MEHCKHFAMLRRQRLYRSVTKATNNSYWSQSDFIERSFCQRTMDLTEHTPVFFCRTGICQTQDIFLREIGTKTIYTFLILV